MALGGGKRELLEKILEEDRSTSAYRPARALGISQNAAMKHEGSGSWKGADLWLKAR